MIFQLTDFPEPVIFRHWFDVSEFIENWDRKAKEEADRLNAHSQQYAMGKAYKPVAASAIDIHRWLHVHALLNTAADYGIIALFPADPADYNGKFCTSYQHVGCHSGADFNWIMASSLPAHPEEYQALYEELVAPNYHYILEVFQERTEDHVLEFKRRLRRAIR